MASKAVVFFFIYPAASWTLVSLLNNSLLPNETGDKWAQTNPWFHHQCMATDSIACKGSTLISLWDTFWVHPNKSWLLPTYNSIWEIILTALDLHCGAVILQTDRSIKPDLLWIGRQYSPLDWTYESTWFIQWGNWIWQFEVTNLKWSA